MNMRQTQDDVYAALDAHEAWLRGGDGERADLSGWDLSGLDMSGRDLSHAILDGANMSGVIAKHTSFRGGASLRRVNMDSADLRAADFTGATYVMPQPGAHPSPTWVRATIPRHYVVLRSSGSTHQVRG